MIKRNEPYFTYLFAVELDGLIAGGFSEVSGLSMQTDTKSFREGGENNFEYVIPEKSKQLTLVLKRGTDGSGLPLEMV